MSEISICQYSKGLLFKRECENPGAGTCMDCKKNFCKDHSVVIGSTVVCIDHAPKDDLQDDIWVEDDIYMDDDDEYSNISSDEPDEFGNVISAIAYQDAIDDDDNDDDFDDSDDDWDDFS